MQRFARGVKAIKLKEGAKVISCEIVDDDSKILVLSENGIGKRVKYSAFMPHHRFTAGIRAMLLNKKTGKLSAFQSVKDDDELLIITTKGMMIRFPIGHISVMGRSAVGNIILNEQYGDTADKLDLVNGKYERQLELLENLQGQTYEEWLRKSL